eukprot:6440246-Pyramimonas_sp.AAC.1
MIHCFLHAAVLASNLWLALLALPENASKSKASRSMRPRSTKRSRMVRSITALFVLHDFPCVHISRSHDVRRFGYLLHLKAFVVEPCLELREEGLRYLIGIRLNVSFSEEIVFLDDHGSLCNGSNVYSHSGNPVGI